MSIRAVECRFTWPGELPDLTDLPLLHGLVTTPHDQTALHRELALIGYVPQLLSSSTDCEFWRWYHPDGTRA